MDVHGLRARRGPISNGAPRSILAAVYQLGRLDRARPVPGGATGVIFGCLLPIGLRRGLVRPGRVRSAFAAFLVAAVALTLRPQLIGMALFAILLVLVTDRRAHPGRLWAIPLIVLAWANIHGSFFLGPLVLGLAWLEDCTITCRTPTGRCSSLSSPPGQRA